MYANQKREPNNTLSRRPYHTRLQVKHKDLKYLADCDKDSPESFTDVHPHGQF